MAELSQTPKAPIILPASRMLRPYSKGNSFFNAVRLTRILNEMEKAARLHEIYHLWWHPHNFGNNPKASMDELHKIVDQFRRLKEQFGMESLTMEELGNQVSQKPEKAFQQ